MAGVRLPTHNTLKTTTMTKENFITKWAFKYNVNYTTNPYFIDDLEAVIATEIAKVQESQPELNPIERAYERGLKIRSKTGKQALWYQKLDENYYIDNKNRKEASYLIIEDIRKQPEKWELYTEPTEKKIDPTDEDWNKWQLTKQPAKPFDKDRFERMFRAVVASGVEWEYDNIFGWITDAIKKLDAFYASKEKGGNNE